jgi:phosphate transport system permease protein
VTVGELPAPGPADAVDVPIRPPRSLSGGDRAFRGYTRASAVAVLTLMGLIGLFLLLKAIPALKIAQWRFLYEEAWTPDAHKFGVGAVLVGTIVIAVIALVVAIPVSLAAALFISEYAPRSMRGLLISMVDLMAAVPSIVYGLWGFFFFQPHALGVSRWLSAHLGWIPLFKVDNPGTPSSFTSSSLIVGIVVSLMVIPICTSVMRQVFSQAPAGEREGAYALGASRWGMIRTVVLPFGRGGIIGASMLGLGRALGETIAVILIISPIFGSPARFLHIAESGGNSISALIALNYTEAGTIGIAALMGAGLVLFALTLVINAFASVIVSRSRSGQATEL